MAQNSWRTFSLRELSHLRLFCALAFPLRRVDAERNVLGRRGQHEAAKFTGSVVVSSVGLACTRFTITLVNFKMKCWWKLLRYTT